MSRTPFHHARPFNDLLRIPYQHATALCQSTASQIFFYYCLQKYYNNLVTCVVEPMHNEAPESPPGKRLRVAVACQRCKIRKQKCDGSRPVCSSCQKTAAECRYIQSVAPRAAEMRVYVKALEDRIAELENSLYSEGHINTPDDHWKPEDHSTAADYRNRDSGDSTVDSLSAAVRDLSLNACGFYVGGSSNFTLGRLLSSVLHESPRVVGDSSPESRVRIVADEYVHSNADQRPKNTLFDRPGVDRVFEAYLKHIATRYPVLRSSFLRRLHQNRHVLEDNFEISVLHLVYAIGERSLELAGQSRCTSLPEEHYEAAMSKREVVLQYGDRRSIVYLALASIYCLRAPRTPGPWLMISHAIKLCISLGLHRKSKNNNLSYYQELDRRLFWSCYCLDMDATIASGRPPTISKRDIDVELPLNVDEVNSSLQTLHTAAEHHSATATSLTGFILEIKMKRIVASIQHEIYRVDTDVTPPKELINSLFEALDKWKAESTSLLTLAKQKQTIGGLLTNQNTFIVLNHCHNIQYCAGVRLLLFPQLAETAVHRPYIESCANACITIISLYKAIHATSLPWCYSPADIQCLFLSGLTLVYCLSLVLGIKDRGTAQNALTDCTIMLYVMSERWHAGQRYRDAFERIKTVAIEMIFHDVPPAQQGDPPLHAQRDTNVDISTDKPGDATQSFSAMLNDIIVCPTGIENEHKLDRILSYDTVKAAHGDSIYDMNFGRTTRSLFFTPNSTPAEPPTVRPNRSTFAAQQDLSAFQFDTFGNTEGFEHHPDVGADYDWFYLP